MKVAVIAGSGLSSVTERIEGERRLWTHPGLDRPPAPGHRMEVVEGSLGGVPALGFGGRLHFYQGYSMAEVVEPVAQAHDWGAEVLFVTNATGSLRAELASGEIALIRDHVNLMGDNPLRGAPNVVLTPHLGASTREAQARVGHEMAEQVVMALDGVTPPYAVNAPAVAADVAPRLRPYVELARRLAILGRQLADAPADAVGLTYAGEIAAWDGSPLRTAALSGLLEAITDQRVNAVNADLVARERGMTVRETRTEAS